ncbi:hypothetical protein BH18CHL2_BH18CHL2_08310 [soil metagenome]
MGRPRTERRSALLRSQDGDAARAVEVLVATGYCVKCKSSREIKDPRPITMKNGRPATQGTCPVCGTKIFKIGASKEAAEAAAGGEPETAGEKAGGEVR